MNLIFMRHGEATDNVKEIISDQEIYWSTLTQNGIEKVKNIILVLPKHIDKIFVSPFPRTIQTAYYVYEKYPEVDVIIDNRIREIYYGKYSGKKNNEELDNVRKEQIKGDRLIRFGDYGENKEDIENRLLEFLKYISKLNNNETILIISHGSIISYMKRLLNIKTLHIKLGDVQIFNNLYISVLN